MVEFKAARSDARDPSSRIDTHQRSMFLPSPLAPSLGSPIAAMPGPSNIGVRANGSIPAKVTAGPLPSEVQFAVYVSDVPVTSYVLEVSYRDGTIVSTLDQSGRWMIYLQAARDRHEQNVEAFKDARGLVYLRTLREICKGEQLYVWFSDDLAREVDIPVLTPINIRGEQQYQCSSCMQSYQYPNTLKSHIKYHCPRAAATSSPEPRAGPATPSHPLAAATSMHLPQFLHPLRLDTTSGHLHPHHHQSHLHPAHLHHPNPYSDRFAMAKHLVSPFLLKPVSPSLSKIATTGPSTTVGVSLGSTSMSAFRPHKRAASEPAKSPQSDKDTCHELDSSALSRDVKKEHPMNISSNTSNKRKTTDDSQIVKAESKDISPSPTLPNAIRDSKSMSDNHRQRSLRHHSHELQHHAAPPPFPMDPASLRYLYPYYPALHHLGAARYCCGTLPSPNASLHAGKMGLSIPMYYPHHFPKSAPELEPVSPHLNTGAGSGPGLSSLDAGDKLTQMGPFKFPLPSEKAGEPLDLLPRSLYVNKSRKGHLCIYCGKLYSRKYGLKIHLRTHTGYKPLKCKVCLRPFGDPSNLNKHIRLHAEGDTPYRCEFCGKVLVRRRDLERHVKSRHPNEMLKLDDEVIVKGQTDECSESKKSLHDETGHESDSACSDLEIDDCNDSVTDIEVS